MHAQIHPQAVSLRRYLLVIAALSILPGCNSDDEEQELRIDPIFGAGCATVSDGPDDLATVDTTATPRADADAETLALEVSSEFIAPEPLYQRIAAELAGIRASFPELAAIPVRPCHLPYSVLVHFTDEGFEQVQNGHYDAWDDFNDNLRLSSGLHPEPLVLVQPGWFALYFEGRYNANRLASGYSALPEVVGAEPNGFVGDGPDICLARREEVHFYIFREAHGDCPAGCTDESFTGLKVDASGNIGKVGEWDGADPAPEWITGATDCRAFL